MKKHARLTSKGQITVPRDIRRLLGVRAGDRLLFEEKGGAVHVRPVRTASPFEKYRGIGTPGVGRGRKAVVRAVRELRGPMTTAIDTNVLVALWNEDDFLNSQARSVLDAAMSRGGLVISAPVFAELLAAPARTEEFLDLFCRETDIVVEWNLSEAVWRAAGHAFQAYSVRQKQRRLPGRRRILADFLIGAHALTRGYRLLTLDEGLYRTTFPRLSLIVL